MPLDTGSCGTHARSVLNSDRRGEGPRGERVKVSTPWRGGGDGFLMQGVKRSAAGSQGVCPLCSCLPRPTCDGHDDGGKGERRLGRGGAWRRPCPFDLRKVGSAHAAPRPLDPRTQVVHIHTEGEALYTKEPYAKHFHCNSLFTGEQLRALA